MDTQDSTRPKRICKPKDFSDFFTGKKKQSLQFRALSPHPLPSYKRQGTSTKLPLCDQSDTKSTTHKTSTPQRETAPANTQKEVYATPPTGHMDSLIITSTAKEEATKATNAITKAHSDLDIPNLLERSPRSLTEMLEEVNSQLDGNADGSTDSTDSSADESESGRTEGLKTLVSESFIDGIALTPEDMKMRRLNKLLFTTGQELQKAKNHQQDLMREMKDVKAELSIKEACHQESKKTLDNLKEEVTKLKQKKHQAVEEVVYFRGWKHTLSAHFPCPVTYNDTEFKTQEHAYCFQKLTTHGKNKEAEIAKKIRNAGRVKAYTHKILPDPCEEWEKNKGQEMYDIAKKRAEQSAEYREALIATGTKRIIHNMETDAHWGFGSDGKGLNLMGTTLEKLRTAINKGEISPVSNKTDQQKPSKSTDPEVVIIADSMLWGIDRHISNADLHIQSGATTDQIRQSLGRILSNKKPGFVVIHCGTNDLETHFDEVQTHFNSIISDTLFHTQGTKIILSGLIHRLDKPLLNTRIDSINMFLKSLQTETVMFVDHNSTINYLPNLLNRGGLHMRYGGTKLVATNISLTISNQTQRTEATATKTTGSMGEEWTQPKPRKTAPTSSPPGSPTDRGITLNNRYSALNIEASYQQTERTPSTSNGNRNSQQPAFRPTYHNGMNRQRDQRAKPQQRRPTPWVQRNAQWQGTQGRKNWQRGYTQPERPHMEGSQERTTANGSKESNKSTPTASAWNQTKQPEETTRMTEREYTNEDVHKQCLASNREVQALLTTMVSLMKESMTKATGDSSILPTSTETATGNLPMPSKIQQVQPITATHSSAPILAQHQANAWMTLGNGHNAGPQGLQDNQMHLTEPSLQYPNWQLAPPKAWAPGPWGMC